jgi:type IV secretion system protein TrbL
MIACGVKILVLMLLMSIITKLVPIWATEAAAWRIDDWSPLWRVAFSAAGGALLAWKAPQIAANAISGTSSLTAGDALQVATMAATAAVATTAMASGAADKVLGGASGAVSRGSESLRNNIGASSIEPITGSSSVADPTGPSPSSNDGSTASLSNSIGSGDAKNSSISPEVDKKVEKHFTDKANMSPPKKISEKMQDGLRTFQSSIPNDQATVGGDSVKLKD